MPHFGAQLSRRELLEGASLAAAAALFNGCIHDTSILRTGHLKMPDPAKSPLTVDTHCHIFNGSDLQAKEFISRVLVSEKGLTQDVATALGSLIQDAAWAEAPSGDGELAILVELANLSAGDADKMIRRHKEDGYQAARHAVLNRRKARAATPAPSDPLKAVMVADPKVDDALHQVDASFQPQSYAEHVKQHKLNLKRLRDLDKKIPAARQATPVVGAPGTPSTSAARSILGVVKFLSEGFQYRIVAAQDYLDTFTKPSRRGVDLMLSSLVDYDWWLAEGRPTATPLAQQVAVMKQISILTGGEIHGFAPFDPLREVAYYAKKGAWSSLDFVQDAILHQGCVGVKLYPPMGFGASGNAGQARDFWANAGLPDWVLGGVAYPDQGTVASFGQRLDDALDALFAWCARDDIQAPILAHSNQTNGTSAAFRELAAAHYWAPVLKKYPTLRLSFGHLGDYSGALDNPAAPAVSQAFIDLLGSSSAYGDSAFDAEILKHEPELAARFAAGYAANPALASRLMYGTDWNLLMINGDISEYMEYFVKLFATLPGAADTFHGHSLRDRFFGWNAVDFVGLRAGDRARTRLDQFYGAHNITAKPAWAQKVDVI